MTTSTFGVQSAVTCTIGIAPEITSGVVATVPTEYIVVGGDISPVTKKPTSSKDITGAQFPSLGLPGVETFEMPLPMLPVIEDATSPTVRRNGLGTLYACLFGADSPAQQGGTVAYLHTMAWGLRAKSFSTWLHFDTNVNDLIRMCCPDNCAIKIKADGLTQDFKIMGADKWSVLDTSYGTAAYCNMATAKQITGLSTLLEFGQPGAAVRNAWEEIDITLNRNLSYGAPGKDGQHPWGSASPQIVTSTKSNVELGITLRDLDREEILRLYAGGNVTPTATRQRDIRDLVKARVTMYGPAICAGINGEADYCNAGTATAAFAGSYTGGSTIEIGEIEMTNYVHEMAQGTNKDLTFRGKVSGVTIVIADGAGVLECAAAVKEVTVTQAAGGSTAAAILAKILATPAAVALLEAQLAEGSTGAGTPTSFTAAALDKDGFKYRLTTGTGWGSWSSWKEVTEAAQAIGTLGTTVDFSADDASVAGDMFRWCSHLRFMLRFNLPDLDYSDAVNDAFGGGIRKADIKLIHPNTANDPSMDLQDTKATAYI